MSPTKLFGAIRLEHAVASRIQECVIDEGPLQIRVNGNPFTVTLRTPGTDRNLVMGILFAEGLVETPADILSLTDESCANGIAVWSVVLSNDIDPSKLLNRSLASTSSCGLCGKLEWHASPESTRNRDSRSTSISIEQLDRCFAEMSSRQDVFSQTGGSHAAAVFSPEGTLLTVAEDAGRHNAVDKAVGELLWNGRLFESAVLCVSGRVSYEIASKARRAGMQILAAVSAPSSMAVEYCDQAGITLLGFCRDGRATVYAHAERVLEEAEACRKI